MKEQPKYYFQGLERQKTEGKILNLCTLKDKFLCTPQDCEKREKGKCDQDRYMLEVGE